MGGCAVSDVIRWEEPPPHGNTLKPKPASKYQAVADALRARPGEWALIAENLPSGSAGALSNGIRIGRPSVFRPAGEFESRCVGSAGSTSAKVYARFVGSRVGGAR
jgi:hypothetical protein